jgi:lipoprotein-anchoring transpeptidase ErfK/SrfK
MGSKLFIFIAIVFVLTATYFSPKNETSNPREPASVIPGEVVSTDATLDMETPDVLVVVDRNPSVQKMQVYVGGSTTADYTFPVSTGRETFDFPPLGGNPYCSFTPTGTFKPDRMRELHMSNTWKHEMLGPDGKPQTDATTGEAIIEGSPMPFAMFFNGGVATHCTIPATDGNIGHRASGGCVRMHYPDCKTLFDLVAQKDETCGGYARVNPNTYEPQCMNQPGSSTGLACPAATTTGEGVAHGTAITGNQCTDIARWPVKKKKINVKVQVIDSRPITEQKCLEQQCAALEDGFKLEKEACLRKKVLAQAVGIERFTLGYNFDLQRKMESMKVEDREKLTKECNNDLAADYKANPRPKMDCTKSMVPPIPQPRPAWRDNPSIKPQPKPVDAGTSIPLIGSGHPVPPLDIIEQAPKDPTTPRSENVEGLWSKEFKRPKK